MSPQEQDDSILTVCMEERESFLLCVWHWHAARNLKRGSDTGTLTFDSKGLSLFLALIYTI